MKVQYYVDDVHPIETVECDSIRSIMQEFRLSVKGNEFLRIPLKNVFKIEEQPAQREQTKDTQIKHLQEQLILSQDRIQQLEQIDQLKEKQELKGFGSRIKEFFTTHFHRNE